MVPKWEKFYPFYNCLLFAPKFLLTTAYESYDKGYDQYYDIIARGLLLCGSWSY